MSQLVCVFRGFETLHHLIGVPFLLFLRGSRHAFSSCQLLLKHLVNTAASPQRSSCHTGHSHSTARRSRGKKTLRKLLHSHLHAPLARQVFHCILHLAKAGPSHHLLSQLLLDARRSSHRTWLSTRLHLQISRTLTAAWLKHLSLSWTGCRA